MFIWIFLLGIASSHVHSAYIPSGNKDLIDQFRGPFNNNVEHSQFAPVVSHVKPGHDVFNGKAHDMPAVSAFKSSEQNSKVDDGFYGAVSGQHDYDVSENHNREIQVVSAPIPDLIVNPEASRYVEPVGILIHPGNESLHGVSPSYQQPYVLPLSPSLTEPIYKLNNGQSYGFSPHSSSPAPVLYSAPHASVPSDLQGSYEFAPLSSSPAPMLYSAPHTSVPSNLQGSYEFAPLSSSPAPMLYSAPHTSVPSNLQGSYEFAPLSSSPASMVFSASTVSGTTVRSGGDEYVSPSQSFEVNNYDEAMSATVSPSDDLYDAAGVESKCQGKSNGTKLPVAPCRRYYSECVNGQVMPRFCRNPNEVFSQQADGCVIKSNAPECNQVVSVTNSNSGEFEVDGGEPFCSKRSDGFYRHPEDCSRILQCFGRVLFEYPPCDRNLAFDESVGLCDYREHVDGCADLTSSSDALASLSSPPSSGGCGQQKHGDHVRNDTDCSAYYRCVWDRLLPMKCPVGTVFNPILDVCDFPDQVKSCST